MYAFNPLNPRPELNVGHFIDEYQVRLPCPGERLNRLNFCHNSGSTSVSPTDSPSSQPPYQSSLHSTGTGTPRSFQDTVVSIPSPALYEGPWSLVTKGRLNMTAGTVKRSASTPNVKHAANSVGHFSTDKRRNKLGYHRTSVACGM